MGIDGGPNGRLRPAPYPAQSTMTASTQRLAILLAAGAALVPVSAWLAWNLARRAATVSSTAAFVPVIPRVLPRPLARAALPLVEACRAAGVGYPPSEPRLVVRKSARLLQLYSREVLVKEYPVDLGRHPPGDKEREGDGRTPDGEFRICTRVERSQFRHFLGLSYPDPAHARLALARGLIAGPQAGAIERAAARGEPPPWDTPLGGAVGLHGGGSGADWTFGCIALDNPAIDELFAALPFGTRVRIEE